MTLQMKLLCSPITDYTIYTRRYKDINMDYLSQKKAAIKNK